MRLLPVVLLLASPAFTQQEFTTKTVPKLAGCCTHQTYALNDNGTVAGISTAPDYSKHVITWNKQTGFLDLGWGYGGLGNNNAGDVVGPQLAIVNGVLTTEPGKLLDINNHGLAVGYDNSGAITWTLDAGTTSLGWGSGSQANAVNDAGTVVGCKLVGGKRHAAMGDADLHPFGLESCATGINSQGQVAGWADAHGWLWDPETNMINDLQIPEGCAGLHPNGINDNGLVVGWMACGPFNKITGFVWKVGRVIPQDLNTLAGVTNGSNQQAMAINRWGQIVMLNRRLLTPIMHIDLTPSINPAVVGQPVTFRAHVYSINGEAPDGDLIQFKMGTRIVATVPIVQGIAKTTITFPYPGYPFTVSAVYVGNGVYARASKAVPETVGP